MPTDTQCCSADDQGEPIREVPAQIKGLDRELDAGHDAVSTLLDRLSHALRLPSPENCGEDESQAETQLGQQIQESKARARSLRHRIYDILDRLEV